MRLVVRQLVCVVFLACGLSACGARLQPEVLTPVARAPSYTKKVQILVATTRGTSADNVDVLTAERSKTLNYARMEVSIPKAHKPGQIEGPDQPDPDPALHFLTTERDTLSRAEFLGQIARGASGSGGTKPGAVLVFVHGYNTLHQEAVYRFAQIVHDSGFEGTAVLFSWPSRGSAPLYLADRDSSTYSRDYFERVMLDIAALPQVREVDVLAHSMGNWLTMEMLRQAKLKGHGNFGGKLGEVVLASPDIDVTVFRTQLDVIAPMRRPMTVLVSGDDKALALSSLLSGGLQRVGSVTAGDLGAEEIAKRYNLRVIDLTGVNDGTSSGHNKFAQSSAVVAVIGRGIATDDFGTKGQSGVFQAVGDVGLSILRVPAAILGGGQ
jgi:esterase/lipase superfamily enzyme